MQRTLTDNWNPNSSILRRARSPTIGEEANGKPDLGRLERS
jgi:hypothetical protein